MTPQPHTLQRAALHELHSRLADGGRGVVVMPCGTGKTLLGRWYAEQLAARTVVVFVPSLALVGQTLTAWRTDTSWRHDSMIVCSDPTSGRAVGVDDLELPDWARAEVAVSTSARAIEQFLAGGGPSRLIVSTYHSAPRVAGALARAGRAADLLVCDEAHRLTGQPRREFRAVLDEQALPARRRLFLTATPVEAAAWAADAEDDVDAPLSLDDEDLFGPTLYRATFADAVAAGRLVDYDVHVLAGRPGELDEAPGSAHAVLTAVRDGARRVLTFHGRVARARELSAHLDGTEVDSAATVRSEHLEARHGAYRRQAALHRLAHPAAGTATVLASARILSEGVDVPSVDTVVFAEPRTSAVDIVQAVGRAMRLSPGKHRGRVVLAVTLDDTDQDEDTALSATAWRHVWITLRALASMDPRFAQRLRHFSTAGVRGHRLGDASNGPGLVLEVPDDIDLERWALRALDRSGGAWWHRYDLVAAHARQYGSARPGQSVRRNGVAIGAWVQRQRTLHRQGVLEPDRVDALEQLPGWAWGARDTAFWQAAAAWARQHDRVSVAGPDRMTWLGECQAWSDASGKPARAYDSLAEFAVDTAARRRRGDLPAFLEAAAAALPCWSWELLADDEAAMVDALALYGEWERDLNPAHDYVDDDGRRLGAWVTALRRRRYTGRLDPVLDHELALLGRSDWAPLRWERGDTAWRLSYLALRQFVEREGTTRIPTDHMEQLPDHELNLSRWVIVQRLEHRQGRMPADRSAALEQVPGWAWEVDLRVGYRSVLDDVEHGTRVAYMRGCRCDTCTDANREYARQLHTEGTVLVAAGPARAHLRALLARGATQKGLARAAGINVKSVINIAEGGVSRIHPDRAELVLALTADDAAEHTKDGRWGTTVAAAGTWRLIDWMVMRGWPKAWISREIGQDGRALQIDRNRIAKSTADKVADLDRRLGRSRRPPARRRGEPLPTLDELLTAEQEAS